MNCWNCGTALELPTWWRSCPLRLLCEPCKNRMLADEQTTVRLSNLSGWTARDILACSGQAMSMIGVPPALQAASLDACNDLPHALVEELQRWSESPTGCFFLHGPAGAGKSWAGVGVLRAIMVSGRVRLGDARFQTEDDFKRGLRQAYDTGHGDVPTRLLPQRHARRVPLLMLDDLGATRETSWGQEQLGGLIAERHAQRLLTIITSNLNLGDIAKAIDSRLASRIAEDGKVIGFPSRDLRLSG